MPKNAVYVGRPGKWGNPFFRLKENPKMAVDRGFLVAVYKLWLNDQLVPGLAALFTGGGTLLPPPSAGDYSGTLQRERILPAGVRWMTTVMRMCCSQSPTKRARQGRGPARRLAYHQPSSNVCRARRL